MVGCVFTSREVIVDPNRAVEHCPIRVHLDQVFGSTLSYWLSSVPSVAMYVVITT